MSTRPLALSDDELSTCVSCGLCLPHCPTFRVSNEEALSPRGRIATIRAIQYEGLQIDEHVSEILNTCVQCRGCEPACPSGVPYGRLIEAAKNEMARQRRTAPWWQRFGLRLLRHHRLLLIGTPLLAIGQRLHLIPKRAGLSTLPIRFGAPIAPTSTSPDVWLFTGCVFFCFFYTALVFNPKETADNLKKGGAFVPGIRPGEQTAKYIDQIMGRLTLVGAVYITLVCLLPEFLILKFNVPFYFGGTSLLIIVVVTMDFMTQVQSHLMSYQYEGLLKKANFKGGANALR